MKKIIYFLLITTTIGMFYSSCKKGAVGPQGSTGEQGVVGPAGPAGANGSNGSVIYAGTSLPATTTGVTGDYYLDSSTGLLYGPKTASGWGAGFSLIGSPGATGKTGAAGATGATGAAGSSVLSGTGVPAAALGSAGDFYLDKTSFLLYGPKLASGWGPATSLQGPAGGAANVEYSGWNIATNPVDSTISSDVVSAAHISAPALTQTIIDGGIIEVYMRYVGEVFTLPYTFYTNTDEIYSTISFLPRPGQIIVARINSNGNHVYPAAFTSDMEFRYVLIPGGTSLALKKQVDLSNYEAVRKYYRIKN